jgi:hypothetical protein
MLPIAFQGFAQVDFYPYGVLSPLAQRAPGEFSAFQVGKLQDIASTEYEVTHPHAFRQGIETRPVDEARNAYLGRIDKLSPREDPHDVLRMQSQVLGRVTSEQVAEVKGHDSTAQVRTDVAHNLAILQVGLRQQDRIGGDHVAQAHTGFQFVTARTHGVAFQLHRIFQRGQDGEDAHQVSVSNARLP